MINDTGKGFQGHTRCIDPESSISNSLSNIYTLIHFPSILSLYIIPSLSQVAFMLDTSIYLCLYVYSIAYG